MAHAYRTVTAAAAALRAGETTPRALLDACVAVIDRMEPKVQAWVSLDLAAAQSTADALGDELAAGYDRGPLHGIPVGVKDIFDIAGRPTLAGSRVLSHTPAVDDAAAVARWRQAGCVILGKTITTEFACFEPPVTRNPWNLAHTPGGSSSGSAAAVATGMCLAALGSQTGGSLIRPAAYCGVATHKPTRGLVSTRGVYPISTTCDHVGCLAPRAIDLEPLFAMMTGPRWQWLPQRECEASQRPWRFGILEADFLSIAAADLAARTRSQIAMLAAAGAEIDVVPWPADFAEILAQHRIVMSVEAARTHAAHFPADRELYSENLGRFLDAGRSVPAIEYLAAMHARRRWRAMLAELFADYDAWLAPSTPTSAPASLATTGDPRFNAPWSFLGWPTTGIPCGLDAHHMPIGLQVIGPPGHDRIVLAAACWIEAEWGLELRPAICSD